jgi:rhamnosyltransferase subunit B
MKVILLSGGSLGDTLPFALVGKHLQARGHDVTLLATGTYEPIARDLGIDFAPSMPADSFDRFIENQHEATLMEKVRLSAIALSEAIEPTFDAIMKLHQPGNTLLCWQGFMVAGRIAQEVLACPSATVQVYPAGFRTADIAPPFHRWPRFLRRWIVGKIDDVMYRSVEQVVSQKRASLRLPPDKRPLRVWWSSPHLQIGLFPSWFQSPQPDWPHPTILTGFPMADRDTTMSLDPAVETFLSSSRPTIVFAPSSLTRATLSFFVESIEMARQLGKQALFLTSQQDLIPSPRPDFVMAQSFAPLDLVLPRCEAIVHQGGIGTIAQSIRAGIPQLTTPVAYDQPDNAYRLNKLGVSINIPPQSYSAKNIAKPFAKLIASPQVQATCADLKLRVASAKPLDRWAEALEHIFEGRSLDHLLSSNIR